MTGGADDDVSALEPLLDLFLYAPLGMIYEYPDVLDTLVKRGKSQVQLAKLMTQMAKGADAPRGLTVEDGLGMAAKLAEKVMTDLGTAIAGAVGLDSEAMAPRRPAAPDKTTPSGKDANSTPTQEPTPVEPQTPPIAGYDTLKAKEIIPLLTDLSAAQRECVLVYEQAHKARKTVVAAITSGQSG